MSTTEVEWRLEVTLECQLLLLTDLQLCPDGSPVVLRPISSAKEYFSRREVAPNFQTNTGETNVMKAADTNLGRKRNFEEIHMYLDMLQFVGIIYFTFF